MTPISEEKKVGYKNRGKKINIDNYKRYLSSYFTFCKFFCSFEFAALSYTCPFSIDEKMF